MQLCIWYCQLGVGVAIFDPDLSHQATFNAAKEEQWRFGSVDESMLGLQDDSTSTRSILNLIITYLLII